MFAGGWMLVLLALVLACLENVPKLLVLIIGYSWAAKRWPQLESNWLGTVAAAALAAVAAAAIAHVFGFGAWALDRIYDLSSRDIPLEALAALSASLAFILPRVLLRSLRPGRIVAPLSHAQQ
jgi:hypothetical protein